MIRPDSPTRAPDAGAIDDAAAAWIVRRHAGLTAAEQEELRRWLAADGRHAAAFAALEQTWEVLNEPRTTGRAGDLRRELESRQRRRTQRWRRFAVAATGLGAGADPTLVLWPNRPAPLPTPHVATVALRRDRQTLPDGSTVELNAGARIAVSYTAERRGVQLLAGEALFSVARDVARPFVVTAGDLEVRAVGTAFSVRHAAGEVGVLVTAGRVSVERTAPPPGAADPARSGSSSALLVEAGARLTVPANLPVAAPIEIQPVSPQEMAAALAWRDRRVELSGTPIAEVVALFNRQNRLQLAVPDASLGRHQLSGVFWSDDPEGFARLLEVGLGVSAERLDDRIVLRPK